MKTFRGHREVEVEQCFHEFGSTCGPASYAAAIGEPIKEVIDRFPGLPDRKWATINDMNHALRKGCVDHRRVKFWPNRGLVLINFGNVHSRRWIATNGYLIYDLNFGLMGRPAWHRSICDAKGSEWKFEAAYSFDCEPVISLQDSMEILERGYNTACTESFRDAYWIDHGVCLSWELFEKVLIGKESTAISRAQALKILNDIFDQDDPFWEDICEAQFFHGLPELPMWTDVIAHFKD